LCPDATLLGEEVWLKFMGGPVISESAELFTLCRLLLVALRIWFSLVILSRSMRSFSFSSDAFSWEFLRRSSDASRSLTCFSFLSLNAR
jgi:hypothetical protein